MRRTMLNLALGLGLTTTALGPLAWADVASGQAIRPLDVHQHQEFQVNGKILEITHAENARQAMAILYEDRMELERAPTDPSATPYAAFVTSGITGEPTVVTLDLSWLKDEGMDYVNLEAPIAAEVLLMQQPDDTFRVVQYGALATGSDVNNTDFGVREQYTTRDDSIDARALHNGPDDDEARAQEHYDENDD